MALGATNEPHETTFHSRNIFNSIFRLAQDYLLEFDKYNPIYEYEWSGFEAQDDYEVKLKFIDFIESRELLEGERRAAELREREFRFELRAVDLNNDKLTDIIYQGPHMGEGSVVHIFMQTQSGFQNALTAQQGIMTVEWKDERLDKLYVKNWGCCADPTLTNSVYQVTYSKNIPAFELVWESVELTSFVTKPKSTFEPIRFEITNEQYKLRANPWIDNKTANEYLEISGNTIGILKQGYKGTAYASVEDETGRIWWYVLIDREHELLDTYINYEYHEFRPHLIGWISSRYVKQL